MPAIPRGRGCSGPTRARGPRRRKRRRRFVVDREAFPRRRVTAAAIFLGGSDIVVRRRGSVAYAGGVTPSPLVRDPGSHSTTPKRPTSPSGRVHPPRIWAGQVASPWRRMAAATSVRFEEGRRHRVRHGLGHRVVFGQDRVHSVTWVDGAPQVEAAAADDYESTRELVGLIRRADGKAARRRSEVPAGYEDADIVVHRDAITGPWARHSLAIRLREDDVAGWADHALLQARLRAARSREPKTGPPKAAAGAPEGGRSPRVADVEAVAAALLAHGDAMAAEGPTNVAIDPLADEFLRSDPFAFLVAVIFDQGVTAERAWAAPWLLRQRLGHLDPARMVLEPDSVRAAVARRPSLHRFVENVPRWLVAAARRVLDDYEGDAARIWAGEPTARELRERLEAFDGIGQKKAAMAVEILERDYGVPIRELGGSDVAFDVHVRRVFLRTGLADVDDVRHIVQRAREAHPERPGSLDPPAWDIGRNWCHPRDPECNVCPLAGPCPRLVTRADAVKGVG